MSASVATGRMERPGRSSLPSLWLTYALVIPILAAIAGFGGVYSYVWVPVILALFTVTLIFVWRQALLRQPLAWHPILIPMLGFAALVFWQWAAKGSLYPGNTLTGLIQLAGCGCAFYLGLNLLRQLRALHHVAWMLWGFTGLMSAEAILQYSTAKGLIYWFHNASYASPIGPFVYRNHYAGCMDLLLPITVWVSFSLRTHHESGWEIWLLQCLAPAAAFASLVLSTSRGGMLAILLEAILAVLVFWPELRRARQRRLALAGFALLALFGAITNIQPVMRRFGVFEKHDVSYYSRVAIARDCLHIFRNYPATGSGFNTFASIFPAYQSWDDGKIWLYAHNDYAQMLAETGLAGAVCTAGFLLFWVRDFWRLRKTPANLSGRGLRLTAFIAGCGFLFHSYGDFEFHAPANALLFFLLAGAALAKSKPAGAPA